MPNVKGSIEQQLRNARNTQVKSKPDHRIAEQEHHPDQLFHVRERVVADGVNQHPDPEYEGQQAERRQQHRQKQPPDAQLKKTECHKTFSFLLQHLSRSNGNLPISFTLTRHFPGSSFCMAFLSAGTCSSNFSNRTPVRLSSTGGN